MSNAGFSIWMVFCTILSLAVLGVFVWAVIKVVLWLTGGGLA